MIQKLFDSDPFQAERLAMVEDQLRRRGISDDNVLRVMAEVPRHLFIPESYCKHAYEDKPVPIGEDQTISQPYIVAAMVQALQICPGDNVLEVGGGTGYQAAVLSRLAREVFTVERHANLAGNARQLFQQLGYSNIVVVTGDGSVGLAEHSPYDRIIVAAAAPHVPAPLLQQLRDGGRVIIPVGTPEVQTLQLVRKSGEEFFTSNLEACRFVPLLGNAGFQPRNF